MKDKKTRCDECKLTVEKIKKWIDWEIESRHRKKLINKSLCSNCYRKHKKKRKREKKLELVILIVLIILVIVVIIIRYDTFKKNFFS